MSEPTLEQMQTLLESLGVRHVTAGMCVGALHGYRAGLAAAREEGEPLHAVWDSANNEVARDADGHLATYDTGEAAEERCGEFNDEGFRVRADYEVRQARLILSTGEGGGE